MPAKRKLTQMTFLRGQDEIFESFEGIHFLMWDPNSREQIPCVISREALANRAAAHEPPLAELQKVFYAYRGEIEHAASERRDRGELDHRRIIRITCDQFPPRPPTVSPRQRQARVIATNCLDNP